MSDFTNNPPPPPPPTITAKFCYNLLLYHMYIMCVLAKIDQEAVIKKLKMFASSVGGVPRNTTLTKASVSGNGCFFNKFSNN